MKDKNIERSGAMEAPAAPARAHNAGDGSVGAGPVQRISVLRKLAAIHRLLRRQALEIVSPGLNVHAHRLSQWRDRVSEAGMSSLKEQEHNARDDEIARLMAKIGDINMANETLCAKIDRPETGTSFDPQEVQEMSQSTSPSGNKVYGTALGCRTGEVSSATDRRCQIKSRLYGADLQSMSLRD